MLIEDVVNYFGNGNYAAASKRLGKSRTTASKWKEHGDHVPAYIALLAEALSGGALQFDKEYYQAELLEKFNAK